MIIASFNVENLFSRPKAMDVPAGVGGPILAAHAELQTLLEEPEYTPTIKERILILLRKLGLEWSDTTGFAVLRKIRGQLLRRSTKSDTVEVVAGGRGDWIGWVELVKDTITAQAMTHTAMVMRDIDADILGVVEAENRPTLDMFSAAQLLAVDTQPYEQVMVIDGNDTRGIDVGVMARAAYPLTSIRSHVFDTDATGPVFSRDCPEYTFGTPGGNEITVLVNHFKSKGYGSRNDPTGAKRRKRQATRVAQIYRQLIDAGRRHVVVLGDLNDDPTSTALEPLLSGTGLRDISEHPDFAWGPRKGTYGGGNEKDKIDYLLLSPDLYDTATGGQVFRKGVYHGPRVDDPWEMYETLTSPALAASDHAAITATLDLA
ncbi:endonuclease/exonuclease/phosphatase family protein [Nakamurella sp. YIM 132087]|uniref:Endonuclease/exonuclease/phosphatase family protein n=1 Tax=Nakamurella alba TaxID=2665158 RepID=A0A7K1FMY4_9ACTN|nr:endonuclease/exonuclease/phosphatase family protein [Nakamurella alba]MTD14593.1 endonuclease/exonuclease/phosphatase family protein [Nakamurella alba]